MPHNRNNQLPQQYQPANHGVPPRVSAFTAVKTRGLNVNLLNHKFKKSGIQHQEHVVSRSKGTGSVDVNM